MSNMIRTLKRISFAPCAHPALLASAPQGSPYSLGFLLGIASVVDRHGWNKPHRPLPEMRNVGEICDAIRLCHRHL
jgi:hypothetical protein